MSATTSGIKAEISADDTNLWFYQGKTVDFYVTWGGASPIDITGWSARFLARDSSDTSVVDLSSPSSGLTIGGTNGRITFSMSATSTAALTAFTGGTHELELTTDAGAVYRAMSGAFSIIAEVVK